MQAYEGRDVYGLVSSYVTELAVLLQKNVLECPFKILKHIKQEYKNIMSCRDSRTAKSRETRLG